MYPVNWFDLGFPNNRTKNARTKAVTLEDLNTLTNIKAMMINAGFRCGNYSYFIDFSIRNLMTHLSLYLLHGVSPSPHIEMNLNKKKETQ